MSNLLKITIGIFLMLCALIVQAQQSAEDYYKIGLTNLNNKNYEEAVKNFAQALDIKPDYTAAKYKLGEALANSGKYDQVVNSLKASVENTGEYAYLTGLAYLKQENYDKAADYFSKAVALNPNNEAANYSLGLALAKSGKYDESIEKTGEDVQLTSSYAYFTGLSCLAQGNYDKALSNFQLALTRDPQNPDAQYSLGLAYERKGDFNNAALAYGKISNSGSTGFGMAAKGNTELKNKIDGRYKALASSNTVNANGQTMLHIAVMLDDSELAAKLLEYGANPNIKDTAGNTPLNIAEKNNNKAMIELLKKFMKK